MLALVKWLEAGKLGYNEWWGGWKLQNLDTMNGGVVGVFIAPTTKLDRWLGCLFDGAPDSPVHTGHVRCPATSSVPLESDRWSSDFWARLDVRWRTGQVLFTVRCASMGDSDFCARIKCNAGSRWRRSSRCSVDAPDSPVHTGHVR
jgi:hypothetical protein